MTTEKVTANLPTGINAYVWLVRLSDGYVFDFADNTWKALASVTTPNLNLTETRTINTTRGQYTASLNLSNVNATLTAMSVSMKFMKRIGGSVSLGSSGDDEWQQDAAEFTVIGGQRFNGIDSLPEFSLLVTTLTNTTDGTSASVKVIVLDARGQLVDLNAMDSGATCEASVERDGVHNQFDLSTGDFGAPNANGWFEAVFPDPNFIGDVGYTTLATVTLSSGQVIKGVDNMQVIP